MEQIFIFDGDCAFCSSSMRLLKRLTKNRVPSAPYQHLDLPKLGLEKELVESAVQYLNRGVRLSGARAIAQCLIDSKTAWAIAGWLLRAPVVISFAELIYEWVARNRHRLPGGTPECQLPGNASRG